MNNILGLLVYSVSKIDGYRVIKWAAVFSLWFIAQYMVYNFIFYTVNAVLAAEIAGIELGAAILATVILAL